MGTPPAERDSQTLDASPTPHAGFYLGGVTNIFSDMERRRALTSGFTTSSNRLGVHVSNDLANYHVAGPCGIAVGTV